MGQAHLKPPPGESKHRLLQPPLLDWHGWPATGDQRTGTPVELEADHMTRGKDLLVVTKWFYLQAGGTGGKCERP